VLNKSLFSSESVEWETPQHLFDIINKNFNFTLDVCASINNHKCSNYFTIKENGLIQSWHGNCWMNPPYGREIINWMKKAYEESQNTAKVICLVPARTDTKWWFNYAMKGQILFIRGRLKFGGQKNSAPFPSAIVLFGCTLDEKLQLQQELIKNKIICG
jgi:phage N-6-adenine-methyltransferase